MFRHALRSLILFLLFGFAVYATLRICQSMALPENIVVIPLVCLALLWAMFQSKLRDGRRAATSGKAQ